MINLFDNNFLQVKEDRRQKVSQVIFSATYEGIIMGEVKNSVLSKCILELNKSSAHSVPLWLINGVPILKDGIKRLILSRRDTEETELKYKILSRYPKNKYSVISVPQWREKL